VCVDCTAAALWCDTGSSNGSVLCPAGFYCPSPSHRVACADDERCPEGSKQPQLLPGSAVLPVSAGTFAFLGAALGVLCIVYVVARRHSPGASNAEVFTAGLAVLDVVSDALFLRELHLEAARTGDEVLATLFACAMAALAADFVLNSAAVAWALWLELQTSSAYAQWAERHATVVGAVCVLASTNVALLTLLESRVFGVDALSAPPSRPVRRVVARMGFLSSVRPLRLARPRAALTKAL
jgi:hypothetical protein